MKKIVLLVISLMFSFQAFADLSDHLRACQRQCDPGCRDLAEEVSRTAYEILDDCRNGGAGRIGIIQACSDTFFAPAEQQQCLRSARSAEVVRACSNTFFSNTDKMACLGTARSGAILQACSNAFFSTADKMTCLQRARSEAVVRECSNRFFSSQDKLDCIGS